MRGVHSGIDPTHNAQVLKGTIAVLACSSFVTNHSYTNTINPGHFQLCTYHPLSKDWSVWQSLLILEKSDVDVSVHFILHTVYQSTWARDHPCHHKKIKTKTKLCTGRITSVQCWLQSTRFLYHWACKASIPKYWKSRSPWEDRNITRHIRETTKTIKVWLPISASLELSEAINKGTIALSSPVDECSHLKPYRVMRDKCSLSYDSEMYHMSLQITVSHG